MSSTLHKKWTKLIISKWEKKLHRYASDYSTPTLFAHIRPQALQSVLGPAGPLRIAGVNFSLIPQCWQLRKLIRKGTKQEKTPSTQLTSTRNKQSKLLQTYTESGVSSLWSQLPSPELESLTDANWPFLRCILVEDTSYNSRY